MRLCTIEDCTNKYKSKGFCNKHYHRFRSYGSPYIIKTEKHGMCGTPTYKAWARMIQRCNNPNVPSYHYYGGRGIKVCDRWQKSFTAFYEDMGVRPEGLELDRINNNGNYEPSNCRWITHAENNRNKSNTVLSFKMAERIRKLHKKGIFNKDVAKLLKISTSNVNSVLYTKGWQMSSGTIDRW